MGYEGKGGEGEREKRKRKHTPTTSTDALLGLVSRFSLTFSERKKSREKEKNTV